MVHRVHNFGAGPSALPRRVLETVREELLDFDGSGMSILESSHRGVEYGRVHGQASDRLRRLLGGAEDHEILFMGGGARTQFSAVPMNLLGESRQAEYVVTGRWSELALEAARNVGEARQAWSGRDAGFTRIPAAEEYSVSPEAAYLHFTSNNTLHGTEFHSPPDGGGAALVCDMSSDIFSRPLDPSPYGLIYAGAQKNLGPAGVTVVIVRRDLLERSPETLPATLSYSRMAAKSSLLNTPPVFAIYVLSLVAADLIERGGLAAAGERNRDKARELYAAVDGSDGFYRGHAEAASRSLMNVTFRLPSEELEAVFLEGASSWELAGLKGHRLVGGVRASIYNAVEIESVRVLIAYMADFQRRCG